VTGFEPPVAVVIPSHRSGATLERAVRSVIEQQYGGDIEVLVVFDGDEPRPIDVETSARRRVRGVVNARARGPAGARNMGIREASTELIGFLDDDDVWLPHKLERQVDVLTNGSGAAVCTGGVIYVADDRCKRYVPDVGEDTVASIVEGGAFLPLSSSLMRRDSVVAAGMFDEAMWVGEDTDLAIRVAKGGAVSVLQEPVAIMNRGHRKRLSLDYGRHCVGFDRLTSKHEDLFRRHPAGLARRYWRLAAVALASGHRGDAKRWSAAACRLSPRAPRNWMMAIAARLAPERAFDAMFAAYQTIGWRRVRHEPLLTQDVQSQMADGNV
jgi:glycosyltransferase involved in cell wall biosynthesis